MPNFQGAVNSAIGSLYRTKSINKIINQGESASEVAKRQLQETVKQRQDYNRAMKEFKQKFHATYAPSAIPTDIAVAHTKQARAEGAEQERLRRQTSYLDRFNKIYGGDTNGTAPTA